MNKHVLVAHALDAIGATRGLLALRRVAELPYLPVLTFHRVRAPASREPFLLDDGVVDATPDEFERRIALVRRFFSPIGIAELLAAQQGGVLPPNPVLVTFDDGYLDNLLVALPILLRHDVKAVFFIATAYVTERRLFWWDRLSYVIKRSTRDRLVLSYPRDEVIPLGTAGARAVAIARVLRIVKAEIGLDLDAFLTRVATAAGVDWTPTLERTLADATLMTWAQVRALRSAGMDIQSHTRTHRVLQTLGAAALRDELVGSRADLERELGAPIDAISYPVGHRVASHAHVRAAIVDAGYRLGFSNSTGTHRLGRSTDPLDIPRLALDTGSPEVLMRARLAAPFVFG